LIQAGVGKRRAREMGFARRNKRAAIPAAILPIAGNGFFVSDLRMPSHLFMRNSCEYEYNAADGAKPDSEEDDERNV